MSGRSHSRSGSRCDLVTTRKTITHTGLLPGVPPNGRLVSIDVMDMAKVRDGIYYDYRGINTPPIVLGQLAQP